MSSSEPVKTRIRCAYYRLFAPYEVNLYNALNHVHYVESQWQSFVSKYKYVPLEYSKYFPDKTDPMHDFVRSLWICPFSEYDFNQMVDNQQHAKKSARNIIQNWCDSKSMYGAQMNSEKLCKKQVLDYYLSVQGETKKATPARDLLKLKTLLHDAIDRYEY